MKQCDANEAQMQAGLKSSAEGKYQLLQDMPRRILAIYQLLPTQVNQSLAEMILVFDV